MLWDASTRDSQHALPRGPPRGSDTGGRAQRRLLIILPSFVWFACSGVVFMFAHVFWQVTLGKVLKVIVVMRSLFIDRTIVKGYNENVYTEDGKVGGLSIRVSVPGHVAEPQPSGLNSAMRPRMGDVAVSRGDERAAHSPRLRGPRSPLSRRPQLNF